MRTLDYLRPLFFVGSFLQSLPDQLKWLLKLITGDLLTLSGRNVVINCNIRSRNQLALKEEKGGRGMTTFTDH